MLSLSGLYRYPLKSGRAEPMPTARLDQLGLSGDRRWMVVDAQSGRFLTQRLLAPMTQITLQWQTPDQVLLSAPGMPALTIEVPAADAALRGVIIWSDSLRVPDAGDDAANWLSDLLGRPCRLVYQPTERARQVDTGYAQVGDQVAFSDGFPLLLIGQASLEDLSSRVGRPLEMLRFRPNLVVAGATPYAEDDWKRIRIGAVEFRVVKGCSRCIITTLDPQTGERSADREPLATLRGYREREGQVYFGQNLIASGEGELALGMPVEVLE
ncbi:MOSC domain-containing protein [Pseudomonas borbori]